MLAFGGPQPESTVEYSIEDDSISSVSSNGLITALALGETRVVGRAVGLDSVTGEKIVYSKVFSGCFLLCMFMCVIICMY